MKLELSLFKKPELIRVAMLIGFKNKDGILNKKKREEIEKQIRHKVNPKSESLRSQYLHALKLFKVDHPPTDSDAALRKKLYDFNCRKFNEALEKMSKRRRKKLEKRIEESLDQEAISSLKKFGKKGLLAGNAVLALQSGAILITGCNLGICILLTQGLSVFSSLIGVTFPFAVYTSAAVAGGKIIAVAGFLSSPFVLVPVIGLTLFQIYRRVHNRQYVALAGVNYLIESKKSLEL